MHRLAAADHGTQSKALIEGMRILIEVRRGVPGIDRGNIVHTAAVGDT